MGHTPLLLSQLQGPESFRIKRPFLSLSRDNCLTVCIICFSLCLYGHCKDTCRGKQQTEVKQAHSDLEQHCYRGKNSSNFVSNLGITSFK